MIGDITSKQIYDIEGTTSPLATGYEFTFPYPGADSIEVFTTGGLTDTAVTSTNWTVDASGATPKVVFAEGYVFPDDQTKLTIIRKVGYTQALDLRNGDTIDADKLEEALDEIIMQVQQVEEKTTRAVLSSVSDTVQISIPDAGSRGGMLLGFDSTGAAVPVLTTDIQQKLTQALAAETHTITLEGQAQGAKADAVEAKTAAQAAQLAAETAQSGAEAAQTASQGLYDSIGTKTTESLGTINTAKTTAVGAVTTQQATSVAAVEAAQATALSEISTAKTTATGAVTSARATAVSAVQSQQSTSVGAVQSAQSSATSAISSYATSMETALDTYTDTKKDEISSWTDTKKEEVTSAATTGVTSVQSAATTAEGNLDDHVGETSDTGTTTLMGKLNAKTASSVATLEAMIETIPQDYSSLSLKAKECTYRIENLEAMASGELYTEHTESTSGGVLSLPSSSPLAPWAEVEKVVGKSIVWNQKFQTNAISNTYGDGTRVTVNGTSVSIVGSSASSDEWYELNDRTLTFTANHKYIFIAEGFPYRINIYSPSWSYFQATENVFSPSSDISGAWVYAQRVSGNVNLSFGLFLVDLTVMFGAGNEPTTVTDGRIAFIKAYAGSHPSYEAGSLHSSTLSKVVSKGRNLWDESSATNLSYTSKDGNIFYYSTISSNSAWTSSNVIGYDLESSTTFTVSCYAKCGTATSIGIVWVYSDGTTSTAIGRGSTSSSSFSRVYSTSDSSKTIAGIGFFYGANGTAYIKDIQIEKGSSVTDYIAPHSSQNVTLPSIELKEWETYIPETGKKESRYEEHLLSSDFTWSGSNPYVGTPVGFTLDKADHSDSILVGYTYTTAAQTQMDDKTYRLITNLRVKDSSYGSLSEFVASLTGKKLLFKKSTVTETTVAEPIDPYISVEAGGSVSVVSTSAQAEATVHYLTDLS